MKPTKKTNAQNENQNVSGGNKSAKNIESYFRSAPKPFVVEKIGDRETTKRFYVKALNEMFEKTVVGEISAPATATANIAEEIDEDNGACALVLNNENKVSDKPQQCAGCIERDAQLKASETKYKALQKVYLTQSHHFSELNIKHNVLLTVKSSCQPGENAVNSGNDDVFSPIELKILQNMSLDKKKDSTFVHQCLEYAYKNELSVLSARTLKGKSESVKFSEDGQEIRIPKKDPLSPEKVDRIKHLFIERIIKCNIDSASFEARIKDSYINKLFASSITNIANKNV